jgi:electron-transferring-flavoprotein dehydrogenase
MSEAEQRESMEFDVLVVGGGPAGLAAAIKLKQLAPEAAVCLVEKGGEIGAHILSGAVIEPRALDELLPDWRDDMPELTTPATDDRFMYLTATRAVRLPTPRTMHNEGNYVVSLGNVCRWLGAKAEALGVEIYPGFAASDLVVEDGQVRGVVAGVAGIKKDGEKGPNYEPGMELRASYTLFAEGCRGSLTKKLVERYGLREGVAPQTYALGVKELWEIPKENHKPGLVWHSVGWPLPADTTYGGSWLYMLGENLVSIGFVVGLDYPNPWLSPFDEFQRFKTHPAVRPMLEGGKRIAYGARALNEGGFQAIPKLVFPGGALIGDCAGFLNVPKIKGTHTSMKSGMVAAEAAAAVLGAGESRPALLAGYPERLEASWVWEELRNTRNIRPAFAKLGFWGGLAYSALDAYVLRGKAPWTMGHHQDHETLRPGVAVQAHRVPASGRQAHLRPLVLRVPGEHQPRGDQPAHLQLRDPARWKAVNWEQYRSPESRYCPAAVYEAVGPEAEKELRGTPDPEAEGEGASVEAGSDGARLVINAQNCVHCKTCDIKDPTQNINWVTPEGGGGPNYIGGM